MIIRPRIPAFLRRGFAVLLGLLIVTPFTAPFSSCPMSLLWHDAVASPSSSPPAGITMTATAEDDAPPSDAFSMQIEEKVKDETTLHTATVLSALVSVSIAQDPTITDRAPVLPVVSLVLRV